MGQIRECIENWVSGMVSWKLGIENWVSEMVSWKLGIGKSVLGIGNRCIENGVLGVGNRKLCIENRGIGNWESEVVYRE